MANKYFIVIIFCFINPNVYAEYREPYPSDFLIHEISLAAENDLEFKEYHINRINDFQKYSDGYSRGKYQEYTFFNNGNKPHKIRLGVWYQHTSEIPSELFMINDVKVRHQLDDADKFGFFPETIYAFIEIDFLPQKETKIRVYDLNYIRKKDNSFTFNGSPRFTVTIGSHSIDTNNYPASLKIESLWINDIFFNKLGEESFMSILEQKGTLSNDLFNIRKTNANTWEIEFTKKFVDGHRNDLSFEIEFGLWGREGVPLIRNTRGFQFNSEEKITPYRYIFLTNKQLQVVRNAYYARHGYIFKNQDMGRMMRESLDAPDFGNINYKENPNFKESMLTDIDRANIEIIKRLEALEVTQR